MMVDLDALAKGPKPWVVLEHYANGAIRECAQPFEAGARRVAARLKATIGNGKTAMLVGSHLVAVTVERRPC